MVVAMLTFLGCLGGGFLGEGASEWCSRIPPFHGSRAVAITDTKPPVRLGRRWDGKEGGDGLF